MSRVRPWSSASGLPFLAPDDHVPCMDDPDVFEIIGESPRPTNHTLAKARDICHSCPMMDRCRDYAINAPESWGMWGGLTSEERLRIGTDQEKADRRLRRRERERLARRRARENQAS